MASIDKFSAKKSIKKILRITNFLTSKITEHFDLHKDQDFPSQAVPKIRRTLITKINDNIY